MIKWTITFLVIAIIAAVFGFTNQFDRDISVIGKILFFIFISLFLLSLIGGRGRG